MKENNLTTYTLNVDGMTCINCQNRIEEALLATVGVSQATVDYTTGKAEVICDGTVTRSKLASVIRACGYRVVETTDNVGKKLLITGIILLIILALYIILSTFGVLNLLVPSQLADSNMGYGMLFVVGLLTSVHCIAMCGGINLSQCLPKQVKEDSHETDNGDGSQKKVAILPAVFYNLGRVVSYTVIGFVMGLVGYAIGGGADVGIPLILQGILKLIAGILMVVMGFNMLGVFPWLRKITPHMPAFLAKKINRKKREGGSSFVVGLINGIMPCGPLQSMWIVALATGSPFAGALSMLLFALGTVPLMLGLGTIIAQLGQRFSKTVMTVGAILVVVMGLAMLSQGGGLTGWLSPYALLVLIVGLLVAAFLTIVPWRSKSLKIAMRSVTAFVLIGAILVCVFQNAIFLPKVQGDVAEINADGDLQTVTSELRSGDYPDITVQVGVPVRWIINAPEGSINGCNYSINIQDFDIFQYEFRYGENIIEFTPIATGAYTYSCWMGMIYGTINVVEQI